MKISIVISTLLSGGAERNACMLANYFIKKNDVSLITLQKTKFCFYKVSNKVKINNLNLLKSNKTLFSKIWNFFKRVYFIRAQLKRDKPDVLVSFLETTNLTVLIASLFLNGIKIKVISDRNNPLFTKNNLFLNLLKIIFYRFADYLVLQTKKIKEHYGFINKKKIRIIPNTISNNINPKTNFFFGRKINVLCVGRLEYQKGYEILLRSLKKLKDDSINFKCDIYGEGSKKSEILKLINFFQLSRNVKLKGVKRNILNVYKKYDIYILSSRFEGFPNSLLEALSSGLACISSDCDYGPKDIIRNNKNGILFKNNNYSDLHKKLKYLINNKKVINLYGKQAKKDFRSKNYNEDKITKWKKIIQTN